VYYGIRKVVKEMLDAKKFLIFWFISAAIFYFAPLVSPEMIATGNARLSAFMASVISAFLLTIATTSVQPVLEKFKIKFTKDWQWLMIYLFTNVLGVWVIARYADLTGVGILNSWTAVAFGILFTLMNYGTEKLLLYCCKKGK
jgi:uncharacterized membrane protein YvlD (DUF360 family)